MLARRHVIITQKVHGDFTYDQGSNHDHRNPLLISGLDGNDHSPIAHQQPGNALLSDGVDRIAVARHPPNIHDVSVHRGMHAMIIPRGQVDDDERTTHEAARGASVPQQRAHLVRLPLDEQSRSFVDGSLCSEATVTGRYDGLVRDGSCPSSQGPGEERVETPIATMRHGYVGHVHSEHAAVGPGNQARKERRERTLAKMTHRMADPLPGKDAKKLGGGEGRETQWALDNAERDIRS